ncbi:MAG: hypothetical protein Q9174_002448, partial [Haloplaca sp. 1 TL-2023]
MLIFFIIFACVAAVRLPPPPAVPITNLQFVRDQDPHLRTTPSVHNITCLGKSDIPWASHWSPNNQRTLQRTCAAARFYGQSDAGLNYGGYCEGGDVAFSLARWDFREQYNAASRYRYIRSLLECRTRCFCNHGLADVNEQPKLVPTSRSTFSGPLPNEDPKDTIPVDTRTPATPARPLLMTRILMNTPRKVFDVGILRTNLIQCGGPLPQFDLPGPWTATEFQNNLDLCAVQLSGGNASANAGAYCHRDGTLGKVVTFADDMTPRKDWTWSSPEFLNVAALRFHCWKNCLCAPPSRKPNYVDPLIPMWDFLLERLPQSGFIVNGGNRNPGGSSTDARGKSITSLTGASGQRTVQQECPADPDEPAKCTVPWRTDLMGPVPDAVAKLAPPAPLPPTYDAAKQCGNRCDSNAECG